MLAIGERHPELQHRLDRFAELGRPRGDAHRPAKRKFAADWALAHDLRPATPDGGRQSPPAAATTPPSSPPASSAVVGTPTERTCAFLLSEVIVSRRTEAVIALAHSGTGCPAVCAA